MLTEQEIKLIIKTLKKDILPLTAFDNGDWLKEIERKKPKGTV